MIFKGLVIAHEDSSYTGKRGINAGNIETESGCDVGHAAGGVSIIWGQCPIAPSGIHHVWITLWKIMRRLSRILPTTLLGEWLWLVQLS